jgi:hypothetical protein
MNKKELTEADIRIKSNISALVGTGWNTVPQLGDETIFTNEAGQCSRQIRHCEVHSE